MIGYLNGKLITFKDSTVILSVGGVGYEVTCTAEALSRIINEKGGELYVYTAVKEDGIYLYGFNSLDEKEIFISLLGVSGVGPKGAIAIVSSLGANGTRNAILTQDVKMLASVKGLGKKTAEKIIVELRGGLPAGESSVVVNNEDSEAVEALTTLGFDKNSATKAVQRAKEQGAQTLEDIISMALRNIR